MYFLTDCSVMPDPSGTHLWLVALPALSRGGWSPHVVCNFRFLAHSSLVEFGFPVNTLLPGLSTFPWRKMLHLFLPGTPKAISFISLDVFLG